VKLNFLESGMDSLQKGFSYLNEYEQLQFNLSTKSRSKKRLFFLKDAVLMIQHGIEILFKQLIKKHNEYLLFSQIDENVKKAFKERNTKGQKSVFEGQFKHKLHTVSFAESIERLKMLPKVIMPSSLEKKVKELELYRNIIMHAEPHLDEVEINLTFDGLANELDNFFYRYIGKSYKTISGYDRFVANFEAFQEQLKANNFALKAQATLGFLNAIKIAKISMGEREVQRITDINICTKFLKEMFKSPFKFGTDLFNGHCWGDIEAIDRIDEHCFRMYADEMGLRYDFKLRSILLYLPNVNSDASPIIFIESDKLDYAPEGVINEPAPDYYGVNTISYLILKESGTILQGEQQIDEYHDAFTDNKEDYNTYFRIYSRGLFCFLNIQGLKYNHAYKSIIEEFRFMDGKDLEVALKDLIKEHI
jgi:hypothetical protein